MKPYADRSEHSGVQRYEIRDDAILVQFQDGPTYLYNSTRPGITHVNEMKKRAVAGQGLSTYISQHVRENYAKKLSE